MTYDDMVHALRAAADVAGVTDLFVFGSQAVLLRMPNAPLELRQSVELDVAVMAQPDLTDKIDGALGEDSMFHRTFGYYVHGVDLEAANFRQDGSDDSSRTRLKTAASA